MTHALLTSWPILHLFYVVLIALVFQNLRCLYVHILLIYNHHDAINIFIAGVLKQTGLRLSWHVA